MTVTNFTPFVRPYNASTDRDAVIRVFRETADTGLKTEPTWTYSSYVWAHPYFLLSPSSCFVLDDGHGTAVGYIIGTADTTLFVKRWVDEFQPTLDKAVVPCPPADAEPTWDSDRAGLMLKYLWHKPEELLLNQYQGLWERWPGHLHIDIRDGWQGKGFGRELMGVFLAKMREEGASGVHLGMALHNEGAAKFYPKMRFERFPEVLDGGKSGEMGRTDKMMLWVMDL